MALLPSNNSVNDIKPVMASVTDVKPQLSLATDIKPENSSISDPTTIYLLPSTMYTIPAGQWIPFAGLTYPSDIQITHGGGVRP